MIGALVKRDMLIGMRHPGRSLLAPAFFLIVLTLFPLALGPDNYLLARAAPGLLIVTALLAGLLSLEHLFTADRDDDTLDSLLVSGAPLSFYATGKIIVHWLLQSLPLIIISPLIVLMMGLPFSIIGTVIIILVPVTLLLILIGAMGVALSLGTKQGSVLLALLILPLYSPVLIFGAGALNMALDGLEYTQPLLLLWALLALFLPSSPLVIAAILKGHAE